MGKWDRFDAYSSLIARGPVFPTAHGQDSEARSGTDWDRGSVARGRAVGETYSEEEFPAGWEARMPTRWASSPGRRCCQPQVVAMVNRFWTKCGRGRLTLVSS